MTDHSLTSRDRLPDALRVLLQDYPREAWEGHPEFSELIRFWLGRHQMFRRLLTILQTDTRAVLDRDMATELFRGRLSRSGNMLLQQLHGHHHIEDAHYFPKLRLLDERLDKGFGLLDADHKALDGLMAGFAEAANGALGGLAETQAHSAFGSLDAALEGFARTIHRHLEDEEDLIVPVLLKYGAGDL